jgi:3-deoxy-D-manno-octulosonic-acid transferase
MALNLPSGFSLTYAGPMSAVPFLYRLAVGAAWRASPLGARGGSKLARGIRGRRDAQEVLAAWGERERDLERPGVWLHAPSVGEALQGSAVLQALREGRPGLQVAFTHFSPSAEGLGARIGADVEAYLPWDIAPLVRRALAGVRPDVVVFTKTEVWPVLVDEAASAGVPAALIGGSVPPGAGRMRWPARRALRATWGRLSVACAITDEDARRLISMGVPEGAVSVTGDPAIDSAVGRLVKADPRAPYLAPFLRTPGPTVVAGSTWPADESVLLPALAEVRRAVPDVRVIIAPHEPSADAVSGLLERLKSLGWKGRPLSAVEARGSPGDAAAVVVDSMGQLAHLYSVGDVAYVGGGFGKAGLHSVLEPAAAGTPQVFGPRHENTGAASDLVAAGGARIAADRAELARTLVEWLSDTDARKRASESALHYIDAHRGAAARTAELLDPLMKPDG